MVKIWQNSLRIPMLSSRLIQAAWIVYLLFALSLAIPGITPYQQLLQTVCDRSDCLTGQLTSAEAQTGIAAGESMADYAYFGSMVYVSAIFLLLLFAAVLIWRKPAHWGAVTGAFWLTSLATIDLSMANAYEKPALLLPGQIIQIVQFVTLVPFLCQTPDGRFQPHWLRWAALLFIPISVAVVFDFFSPMDKRPLAILFVGIILGSLVFRYRSLQDSVQKEALRWALTGTALLGGVQWMGKPVKTLPLLSLTMDMFPTHFFSFYTVMGLLLLAGGLTCLAVAILGDELFSVDVVLNRAIVYSFLTLFVIGSYILIVGYLSSVFQSIGNLLFSLLATGVVAALFHPIREWLQRFVNRMIYGERDDPYTIISQLGQRLEAAVAFDEVIPTILRTVREGLKVSYTAIALSQSEENAFKIAAEDGQPAPIALTLPLVYQKETVGQLHLGHRQGENTFSSADLRLLDGLARQAGSAIHAARLTADLQRARERLVMAQEEERRRIRRDLHDGLGASLAALNLQAGEVQRLLSADLETANHRMADLRDGLRSAIGDTRRLVYGLRPPALDELGLLEALRNRITVYQNNSVPAEIDSGLAVLPVQIRFDAPDQLPSLPAALEVAIYRIVEEGLANIVHHAQAKNGRVALIQEERGISIEIQDDGVGISDVYLPGIGLRSMRERSEELGGKLMVKTEPGQGTLVCAWLPMFSNGQED